ncbi:helix-turn-helix transcriptional regulator [Pseudomonas carnis]|uniref:helix-turn-helix domain-containing protein n=1 Tax=Pseudomonas TaxID=286 RepID=UPI0018E77DF6|nr:MULTISPECIES: helix-turn-helix transcriptional regulator [Pseudomonas]MBJ2225725.1 helix-turn-helix transcriptional regulator [Pseudomonas sp. MF7451]MBW9236774.1 helix-turn-helix transcriptional regulator [Pseudomonas carnis]
MSNKPFFDGEKLALLRARAGITQRALADNVGATAAMICRYEAGTCQPRLKVVVRLEDAFCVERGGLYASVATPSTDNENVSRHERR